MSPQSRWIVGRPTGKLKYLQTHEYRLITSTYCNISSTFLLCNVDARPRCARRTRHLSYLDAGILPLPYLCGTQKLALPLHLDIISFLYYPLHSRHGVFVSLGQGVVTVCCRRVSERQSLMTTPVPTVEFVHGTRLLAETVHTYIRQFGQLTPLTAPPV